MKGAAHTNIIYQGVDITDRVLTLACSFLDTVGEADTLDVTFDNSAAWFGYDAQPDDTIEVREDNYTTGTMYVNAVQPQDGKYRLIASGLKCAGREKMFRAWSGYTVSELFRIAARQCGAEARLAGTDGSNIIPFVIQENESGVSLLNRVCGWEKIALKATQGRLIGIGCDWVQTRPSAKSIRVDSDVTGITYTRNDYDRWQRVTVSSEDAKVSATDSAAAWRNERQETGLPARTKAQAGRWARGLLYRHNLETETVRLETAFDGTYSAMVRVDIASETDMAGQWLVREARHDFIDRKSAVTLCRCIDSIR